MDGNSLISPGQRRRGPNGTTWVVRRRLADSSSWLLAAEHPTGTEMFLHAQVVLNDYPLVED
jgi:hypothetical protein